MRDPTFAGGFADQTRSQAPELWDRLELLVCPHLGPSGRFMQDVSGNNRNMTSSNIDRDGAWISSEYGWVMSTGAQNGMFLFDTFDTSNWVAYSVSVFYRRVSPEAGTGIICDLRYSGGDGYRLHRTTTDLFWSADDTTVTEISTTLGGTDYDWHTITGVHDVDGPSNNQRLYLDGDLAVQGTATFDFANADGRFTIAARDTGTIPEGGDFAIVMVHSRPLSANEHLLLHQDFLIMLRERSQPIYGEAVAAEANDFPFRWYYQQQGTL